MYLHEYLIYSSPIEATVLIIHILKLNFFYDRNTSFIIVIS